jgi:hypothetical protein
MGVTYSAGFDVSAIRDGVTATDYAFSMTITGAGAGAGFTPITVAPADFTTYEQGVYQCHTALGAVTNHEGVAMFADYDFSTQSFAQALQTILNDKGDGLASPWPASAFAVSFSGGVFTIARQSGTHTFTIAWGNLASRKVCGFTGNESTPGTTFSGSIEPTYYVNATQGGRSLDREGDYEPEGIAAIAISASATHHAGVSRGVSPKFRSWFQHFEVKRKVFKASADGNGWAFEHLFEHCRCEFPFLVADGAETMACVFTSDGAVFANKQRSGGPGDDVHFHVPFNVWHAGDAAGG